MLFDFFNKKNNNSKKRPPKPRVTEGGVFQRKVLLKEHTTWRVNGREMPVELHRERRNSWRYTFGKKHLIVRIPILDAVTEKVIIAEIIQRLSSKTVEKPVLLNHYNQKKYEDGEQIQVGTRLYTLSISNGSRLTSVARLASGGFIEMELADNISEAEQQKTIATLLSRVVAQDQHAEFTRRVLELNNIHFKKTIRSVNFKNNHTNWGSCSSSANLNFSTRLLFAPPEVQDYVIIHELAHLTELNHSDNFWHLIARAMPDFAEKEDWLKKNGHLCRF